MEVLGCMDVANQTIHVEDMMSEESFGEDRCTVVGDVVLSFSAGPRTYSETFNGNDRCIRL